MQQQQESYIQYDQDGRASAFIGPDATAVFGAAVLRGSIKLMMAGVSPTRGTTMAGLLQMASRLTGKQYKRGQSSAAIADLTIWINNMKCALPEQNSPQS